MSNKFVTALKENKQNLRKKVIITTAVTVGVIATAVVLSKMKDSSAAGEVYDVLSETAEGVITLAPATE